MATNYDKVDLRFSWNGDYTIGPDGDLADTNSDHIEALVQDIQGIVGSSIGDWAEHPSLGASLDDFVGEANTRANGQRLKERIISALVLNNIILEDDLDVRVVPVGPYSLMSIIRVRASATPNNSLSSDFAVVSIVFDYQERGVYFVDNTEV